MNLLEFQRQMAGDVRRPLTADFEMQCESERGVSVAGIAASYVKPNDRLSSFERLEIYNRQYWLRVLGALEEDYSALQAVIGNARFQAMAVAYLQENPSRSFTLRDLGSRLPVWLETHPEFAGRRRHLALDVARLEWAYVEAFDAASLEPWIEADLVGLNQNSAIALQPHIQLLALDYPVDELVLLIHRERPAVDMMSSAMEERRGASALSVPRMQREKIYLAVHRFEDTVYYRRLDRASFQLLFGLRQGLRLGEALETAFLRSRLSQERRAAAVEACFAHGAELGWFVTQRSANS